MLASHVQLGDASRVTRVVGFEEPQAEASETGGASEEGDFRVFAFPAEEGEGKGVCVGCGCGDCVGCMGGEVGQVVSEGGEVDVGDGRVDCWRAESWRDGGGDWEERVVAC